MRTPIYVLVAALFFGGCTHYHVTPAGGPVSQPDRIEAPEPEPIEPLELDIGRPNGGQLLIQTNRPAYVAIFEIIPNRGVTLIYPAAVHQQRMVVSGLTWVPLWWSPRRVSASDRYIYAVASEEPLRLSGETFEGGYFSRVLGVRIYRAESPYTTMRAISRTVVPDVAEEAWAEDVQVITPTYLAETYRTVRIFCPGGRVFDVPEEMVARIWCPTRTRVVIVDASQPRTRGNYPVSRPVRPDSVYGQGGRRIKLDPRPPRGPVIRVVDPSARGNDRDDRRGRPARDDRDDRTTGREEPRRDERDDEVEKPKRGRIGDLIRDAKKEEQEREKQERERRRQEAEEARRREAEERQAERDERKAERDERKEERRDEREARKDERDERKDERREEPRREDPKQQGQARAEEKQQEKQPEKREEPRAENREDTKRRGGISDVVRAAKEKQEKQEREKQEREKQEKEKKEKP